MTDDNHCTMMIVCCELEGSPLVSIFDRNCAAAVDLDGERARGEKQVSLLLLLLLFVFRPAPGCSGFQSEFSDRLP